MKEYVSVLPPPYPPLPLRVWQNEVPRIRCPFCGSAFDVSRGVVECPECGVSYIVSEWSWDSFLMGLGVGLLIGLIISAGIYYYVLRPYVPLARLIATLRAAT